MNLGLPYYLVKIDKIAIYFPTHQNKTPNIHLSRRKF